MGAYVAKANIENVFGKDNVARWSNLDGEVGADAARITLAIETAEEDVENRFRDGRYAVPFSPTTSKTIRNWCARLAGIWLFENRPAFNKSENQKEGFQDLKDDIASEIEAYTSGQRKLSCTLADEVRNAGPVVV